MMTLPRRKYCSHSRVANSNGGTAELLASNIYDKFGRLKSVLQGTAAGSTNYGYNVRSWMTSVKAVSFQQLLLYQNQTASSTPCYNGNISAMKWGWSGKLAPTDTYIYKYDGADRLASATHTSARAVLPGAQRANHSVSYAYDPNSNMTALTRYGINLATGTGSAARNRYGVIDRLTMTYDGNRLLKADDTASELTYAGAMDFKDYADTDEEYVYDANGNMTADLNKEMSVTYNELNLPSRYWFDSGHYINLQYTADGALVRKIYGSVAAQMAGEQGLQAETMAAAASESRLEERCGNHVFYDKVLERSYNDYGYWVDGAYHYNICDYLGNVRTVVKSDGTLCERNDYYPFGMLHDPTAANADVQPRKYGGKELDRQNGLDLYDSQARWYDPILARTTTMDAKAESYYDISPYVWCGANPIRNIDPTGMDWVEALDGDITWRDDVTSLNYKDVLNKHEIYRGTTYEREKIWIDVNVRGNSETGSMTEYYLETGKMEYRNNTPWMDAAYEEMKQEIQETGDNPEILKYFDYTQLKGSAASKTDQTAWCAAFVNYCLEKSGTTGTMHALAFSFKNWGEKIQNPAFGSIAIHKKSHVGFVIGKNNKGSIVLLGGNQNNAVNMSPFLLGGIDRYVYPSGQIPSTSTLPTLDIKKKNVNVNTR